MKIRIAINNILKFKSRCSIDDIHKYTGLSYERIYEVLNNNKKFLTVCENNFGDTVITSEQVNAIIKIEAFNNGEWYNTHIHNEYSNFVNPKSYYIINFNKHQEFRNTNGIEHSIEVLRDNFFNLPKLVVATDENIKKLELLGCVREDKWKYDSSKHIGWKE